MEKTVFLDYEKHQTQASAARELGVSRERVRQLVVKGCVPGVVVHKGRKYLPRPCVVVQVRPTGRPRNKT